MAMSKQMYEREVNGEGRIEKSPPGSYLVVSANRSEYSNPGPSAQKALLQSKWLPAFAQISW